MDFATLEWGIGAKGSGGRKAIEIRCNKAKTTSAVVLQGVRCIRKATWGQFAKGAVKTQRLSERCGRNTKGRAETRPDAINILHFPSWKDVSDIFHPFPCRGE